MFIIIVNIIGIIFCIVWLILASINEEPGSAIMAALLLTLNSVLLMFNIDKMNHPDKFNVKIIETKTPPTIDTLIRYGAVSDTTYVITAIDAKLR